MEPSGLFAPGSAFLYHYTRSSTALELILFPRWDVKLRLAPPRDGNDPLEGREPRFYSIQDPGLRAEGPKFMAALKAALGQARIACFSTDAPGTSHDFGKASSASGWALDRMWAQYADNHRGICLVFWKDRLVDAFHKALGARTENYAENVVYGDGWGDPFPDVKATDSGRSHMDWALETRGKIARDWFFRKRKDWEGEREFRLLHFDEPGGARCAYLGIAESLAAVIVGSRFPEAYKAAVLEACKSADVPAFRIDFSDGVSLRAYA